MATLHTQSVPTGPAPSGWRVVRVPEELRLAAIARLLPPRQDEHELRQAALDFHASLAEASGDTAQVWAAVESSPAGVRLGQVAMAVPANGRTAGIYLSGEPPIGIDHPIEVLGVDVSVLNTNQRALQRTACARAALLWLRGEAKAQGIDVHLAQSLIEPHQSDIEAALLSAGFVKLAELAYLRRDIPRYGRLERPALPAGVGLVSMRELGWTRGTPMLLQAMSRSYEGTLDCPMLCEIRKVEDVLTSHKSVGIMDESLWQVVTLHGEPHGCILLSPFEQHETVELVYLGLGPALRGMGLAQTLLKHAVATLQDRHTRCLACAVDLQNTPALKLYKGAKFRQFAKRVGFIADVRAK